MRPRWVVPVAVGAVVLLVATVVLALLRRAGDGDGRPAPPPPAYDPPGAFATGSGVPLPRELDGSPIPAVLNGFDLVAALPSGLQVLDTRTGTVRAWVAPGERTGTSTPPRAPVIVRLDGRSLVVGAFRVEVPGHGTTMGHDAVEVIAVDTAGYGRAAGARIDLSPSLSEAGRLRSAWVVGSGSDPQTRPVLVVTTEAGPERRPVSYGVDLSAGRVRWQADGFAAAAVTGGLAVGAQRVTGGQQLGAVRLADGRRAWVSGTATGSVTAWPAGPAVVAGLAVSAGNGERTLSLVETAGGRVLRRRSVGSGVTCRFDGRQTTVCSSGTAGSAWATGFDASTGRSLWELPDAAAGRVAPEVGAVWHGVAYGSTTNGPVALDARTGSDRPRSPGVTPDLVNAYVGVVAADLEHPRPSAHLAVP
ncbi:MAG: hypothetical protein QG622_339 [Actinomycetota bacterium]|nr:hypothetical protein [Actinomycetota bacterium]